MVKGISRRVILVEHPNNSAFEQAIFILPQDNGGVSQQQLVDEAVRIARNYANTHGCRRRISANPALWAVIGSGITGIVWLLVSVL